MNSALKFLVLFAVTCVVLGNFDAEWTKYKSDYYKTYSNPTYDALRKEIYRLNVDEINAHNVLYDANKVSYSRGTTESTDYTVHQRWALRDQGPRPADASWAKYKAQFNKSYATPMEDMLRETIYHIKVGIINKHNENFKAGKVSWSMGINQFTDVTAAEMKKNGR